MAEIRVFHTHIEVYPYTEGDSTKIENMFSYYDKQKRKRIPLGYYILNDTLYLPRGTSSIVLSDEFRSSPLIMSQPDKFEKIKYGEAKFAPKSIMQEHALAFLCSKDQFSYTSRYSQFGLNLQTGDGKTYSAISAILYYKLKSIIITHQEKIKVQWIDSFNNMTTFPMENLVNVTGTEVMDEIMADKVEGEIYLVNHQTIEAYARANGWEEVRRFFIKIKCGIKVVDEAHKFFEDTMMIDNFSNCYKSFYLTATYGRSSTSNSIYFRAFSSLVRFGEETLSYKEKRKHTNFVITYFTSVPELGILPRLETYYGFSEYRYIDYELNDANNAILKALKTIINKTSHMEGKTIIFSPKIDSVEAIANYVKTITDKKVGILHSKSEEDTKEVSEYDIISTTVKSAGEGVDIKGLRIIICLEPIASPNLADQVRGRLREYSKDEDTFMFYLADTTVETTVRYVNYILPVMKRTCKEIMTIRL